MSLELNLNLNKPLVFLKIATTGMNPVDTIKGGMGDRIIEISIIRIEADRKTVKSGTRFVNPGRSIPQEATKINGITDSDVAGMPKFEDIAQNIFSFIGDADFAGFNVHFDLKFLVEEFNRAGISYNIYGRKIIDLNSVFLQMEKRDFRTAALKFAGQNLSETPISSQTANNIAIQILNGMVSNYSSNPDFCEPNPEALNEKFNKNKKYLDVSRKLILNENKQLIFASGKYENVLVSDVYKKDPQYIDWAINISDYGFDSKYFLRRFLDKEKQN